MPELPEVETVVRALRPQLVGATFADAWTDWPRHIAQPAWPQFRAGIRGRTVKALGRRAKYIVATLDSGQSLLVHLKMTGHLSLSDPGSRPGKYVHTILKMSDGRELRFRDPRKFGRLQLVDDAEEVLGKLGPEPLADSFTIEQFTERLRGRSARLKSLLLDQTFVAGIGNIYADESLFAARLHPERRADTLSAAEIAALHQAIQEMLRLGIAREGASISNYVKPDGEMGDMQNAVQVFRRTGYPCYRCGQEVKRIVLGGRGTHFCAGCQV